MDKGWRRKGKQAVRENNTKTWRKLFTQQVWEWKINCRRNENKAGEEEEAWEKDEKEGKKSE